MTKDPDTGGWSPSASHIWSKTGSNWSDRSWSGKPFPRHMCKPVTLFRSEPTPEMREAIRKARKRFE